MKALREALLRGRRRPRRFGAGSPTSYRGDGYEFVELREYVPGDDVRRIDWAATARSGTFQTRVVLEDVALTLAAVIDRSASMHVGRRRPLLRAAEEAASEWFAAAERSDRCVTVEEGRVCSWAAISAASRDVSAALRTARAALRRGTALLAVGDWYGFDDGELLAELASRHDCTALVARDPWYDGLPLRGLVRIRDPETGVSVRAYIGRAERRRFEEAVRARETALVKTFARAGWRCGLLHESNGRASLLHCFGLAERPA